MSLYISSFYIFSKVDVNYDIYLLSTLNSIYIIHSIKQVSILN